MLLKSCYADIPDATRELCDDSNFLDCKKCTGENCNVATTREGTKCHQCIGSDCLLIDTPATLVDCRSDCYIGMNCEFDDDNLFPNHKISNFKQMANLFGVVQITLTTQTTVPETSFPQVNASFVLVTVAMRLFIHKLEGFNVTRVQMATVNRTTKIWKFVRDMEMMKGARRFLMRLGMKSSREVAFRVLKISLKHRAKAIAQTASNALMINATRTTQS